MTSIPENPKRPNVLLLIIDALRLDVFEHEEMAKHCWPNLWRLAQRGHLVKAMANAPATQFVCPSIFSMRYPLDEGGYNYGVLTRERCLAEEFKDAGYVTEMHSLCAQLGVSNGYQRGFDTVYGTIDYRFVIMYFGQNILRNRIAAYEDGRLSKDELIQFFSGEYKSLMQGILDDYQIRKINKSEIILRISNYFIHNNVRKEIDLIEKSPGLVISRIRKLWPLYYTAFLGRRDISHIKRFLAKSCIGLPYSLQQFANNKLGWGVQYKYGRCTLAIDGIRALLKSLVTTPAPWFAYVHWMDVHDCAYLNRFLHKVFRLRYWHKWRRFKARSLTRRYFAYDSAVMDLDRYVGRIVRHLDRTNQSSDTVLVVTSDHARRKAGWSKRPRKKLGLRLNWEDLSIPIIIDGPIPDVPAGVGLLDSMSIGTSCLEAVGLTPPEGSRSKSIFSSGNPVTIAESAGRGFCDVKNDDLHFAIATDRHKLLVTLAGNEKFFLTELYDLDVDPEENSNVVCQEAMKPTIRKLLSHLWRERGEIMKLRELDQIKLDEYLVWQIPDTQ